MAAAGEDEPETREHGFRLPEGGIEATNDTFSEKFAAQYLTTGTLQLSGAM